MHDLLDNRPESAEVSIDAFVVMPNHVHILFYLSLDNVENTISSEMKWFKGVGRSQYAAGVRAGVLAPYREKLWQQGFNDEIIRDDRHLDAVRLYIAENPQRWESDEYLS